MIAIKIGDLHKLSIETPLRRRQRHAGGYFGVWHAHAYALWRMDAHKRMCPCHAGAHIVWRGMCAYTPALARPR